MKVDIDTIKKLKDMTGIGIMDAKKYLVEASGDFDKALTKVKEVRKVKVSKLQDRVAKAGRLESYIHNSRIGVLVEVNCETDFAANSEEFKTLVFEICLQVAGCQPTYVSEEDIPSDKVPTDENKQETVAEICLLNQAWIKDQDKTIADLVTTTAGQLGEKIIVRRFACFELGQ